MAATMARELVLQALNMDLVLAAIQFVASGGSADPGDRCFIKTQGDDGVVIQTDTGANYHFMWREPWKEGAVATLRYDTDVAYRGDDYRMSAEISCVADADHPELFIISYCARNSFHNEINYDNVVYRRTPEGVVERVECYGQVDCRSMKVTVKEYLRTASCVVK